MHYGVKAFLDIENTGGILFCLEPCQIYFLLAFISYTAYFSVPLQLCEDPQGLKYLSGCIAYMTFHIA